MKQSRLITTSTFRLVRANLFVEFDLFVKIALHHLLEINAALLVEVCHFAQSHETQHIAAVCDSTDITVGPLAFLHVRVIDMKTQATLHTLIVNNSKTNNHMETQRDDSQVGCG
jgi:hypothetical protein